MIGHDWGSDAAWKTAWMHPERISAVAGLSVPFVPRAPAPPLGILRQHLGEDFYIVWFQEPGVAEEALSRDVRRTLATTRVWTAEWGDEVDETPPTPSFIDDEELDVYVEAFERTGFRGGLWSTATSTATGSYRATGRAADRTAGAVFDRRARPGAHFMPQRR